MADVKIWLKRALITSSGRRFSRAAASCRRSVTVDSEKPYFLQSVEGQPLTRLLPCGKGGINQREQSVNRQIAFEKCHFGQRRNTTFSGPIFFRKQHTDFVPGQLRQELVEKDTAVQIAFDTESQLHE